MKHIANVGVPVNESGMTSCLKQQEQEAQHRRRGLAKLKTIEEFTHTSMQLHPCNIVHFCQERVSAS